MTVSVESPLERLAAMPLKERERLIAAEAKRQGVTVARLKASLIRSWRFTGRPKQQVVDGDWMFHLFLAGRGWGKTVSGTNWAKDKGLARRVRFGVIAPTLGDVRSVCFEGETGLLSVIPTAALLGQSRSVAWNKSLLELTLANGTIYKGFSSEEPNRLRGPQHHYVWGEEVSSWQDAAKGDATDTTFSNMKLGLRLGAHPQAVLTSTPKANKLTKELVALAQTGTLEIVKGSSYENRSNLSEAWWEAVVAPLEGTRTGKQEILAELLDDVEGALWSLSVIDALRVLEAPDLQRVVVAVDPNASSGEASNSAGIVVVGLAPNRGDGFHHGYVLADRTITRGGPRAWAQAAVDAYHDFEADRIVAEKNNGGEMVEVMLKTVDPSVPVRLVSASKGKRTRAEPIAALYEGSDTVPGRVHHVGAFPALEEEQTTWTPESESPDRMDALVWGLSELMLKPPPQPTRSYQPSKGRLPVNSGRSGR